MFIWKVSRKLVGCKVGYGEKCFAFLYFHGPSFGKKSVLVSNVKMFEYQLRKVISEKFV